MPRPKKPKVEADAAHCRGSSSSPPPLDQIQPNIGDCVCAKYSNGMWYWGVVADKFWKTNNYLYYSIQYDDGEFVKEHKAADGIATTAQYYNTESMSEAVPAPIQSSSCPTPDDPPSSTNSNTEIKIAPDAARSAVVVTPDRAPSSSKISPNDQTSASIHRSVLDSSNQDTKIQLEGSAASLSEEERLAVILGVSM